MSLLSTQQVEQYKRDGFICNLPILDSAAATHIRQQFDDLEAQTGKTKSQVGLIDRHFDQQFIWALATHPKILDCIEALMGPDILLISTHFFTKYGEGDLAKSFVAWHQDVTYWGLQPPFAMTAWYAVDDADQENGCMRAIPGSHLQGIQEHGKAVTAGNLLSINQEVSVTLADEARAVDMPLKAGEISIHDGTVVHGSLPNRSTRRRCGLTLRYIPPWVKQSALNSHGKEWKTILVRGVDKEHNFKLLEPPFPLAG